MPISEFEFIESLKAGAVNRAEDVDLGIGDDAAVFAPKPGMRAVVSTDLLMEGIHFIWRPENAYYIGRKTIAVNLSDMAAMGATPRHVFISLAKPKHVDFAGLAAMYRGVQDMCREFGINILGGDTTSSQHDLVINIAIYGEGSAKELIMRGGGKPGDILLVSDYLGDARAGLKILLENKAVMNATELYLLQKHLDPRPNVAEGLFFAKSGRVSAMLDLSDGLSSDVRHLGNASNCGVVLWQDKLPLSPQLRTYAEAENLDAAKTALAGGDDYFLLLASPANKVGELQARFKTQFGRPLFAIGELTAQPGFYLQTATGLMELEALGWDHFLGPTAPSG